MLIPTPAEDTARAAAVEAHIVRHAADALRLLHPAELVACYQQQPAIRPVIELAIAHNPSTLRFHKVALDVWRGAAAIDGALK